MAAIRSLAVFVFFFAAAQASADQTVYESDFSTAEQLKRWQLDDAFDAAKPGSHGLGLFGNGYVELPLSTLPKHAALRIRMTLRIVGPWSGEVVADDKRKIIGPDQWGMRLVGDRTIIHATFSNVKGRTQSYPQPWRQIGVPAQTKAKTASDRSSTYELDYIIPHSRRSATLRCYGEGLREGDTWAIDNVRIDALKSLPKPAGTDISGLVEALHSWDADKSEAAAWELVWRGDESIGPLIESLKDVKSIAANAEQKAKVTALIRSLDDDDFDTRESATRKLKAFAAVHIDALNKMTKDLKLSYEQRWRLDEIIKSADLLKARSNHRDYPPTPNARQMQRARALRVLELIGTSSATSRRRNAILFTGMDALDQRGYFIGSCGEDGYPTYPFHMNVYSFKGKKVTGEIHWPTHGNGLSPFKCSIDDNRLKFTVYEMHKGTGIKTPIHYRGVLVGNAFTGSWYTKKKQTSFQMFTNLHIYK